MTNNLENKKPEPKEPEGRHFEVVKRFLEARNEEAILSCLERMDRKKVKIGMGNNAEVFGVEGEPLFENICVKKILKYPKVKINSIEAEFEFQEAVHDLNIKTPRNILMVRNNETKEEFILMEKIRGASLGDILDPQSNVLIPDTYNHEQFFETLKKMVDTMHENNIYHRDLHSGNVMVDEEGNPVVIDFGAADHGYGGHGDDHEIYKASGFVLVSEKEGKYTYGQSILPNDDRQVKLLEESMRKYKK